jgi:hypothetical protein
MSLYGQMMGNYVEHRVDEDEAMAVARTLHPELSKCNCVAVRSECRQIPRE